MGKKIFILLYFLFFSLFAYCDAIEHVIGSAQAKVTVIEYSSFTCPYCADFSINVFPDIKKKYIDTGKVRFVFKPFPIEGYISVQAEQVADCVVPDRYLIVRNAIFSDQDRWLIKEINKPVFKKDGAFSGMTQGQKRYFQILAHLSGLGDSALKRCLLNKKMIHSILESRMIAQNKIGIHALPAFIINGKKYFGFQSESEMSVILDKVLSE